MKKLALATALILFAGAAMADRACVVTASGRVYCGTVVLR